MLKFMDAVLLTILLVGLLFGQVVQLPLAASDLPLIDVAVVVVIITALLPILFGRVRLDWLRIKQFWPLGLFAAALALSWVVGLTALTTNEAVIAGLYLIRLLGYLAIPILLTPYLRAERLPQYANGLMWAFVTFGLIGFLQLAIFTDFGIFEYLGWDPHQGRLLSTFLDPNFAGIWLSFGVGLSLFLAWWAKGSRARLSYWAMVALLSAATLGTLSRSALLSLVLVLGTSFAILSWRRLWIPAILLILIITVSPELRGRVVTGLQIDDTVGYRVESWQEGARTWITHPVTGVGYNALAYRRYEHALPGTTKLVDRAATGYDSSLITIAASSGSLGLLAFLALLWTAIKTSVTTLRRNSRAIFSASLIAVTAGLIISSWFVNAWLYGPILLTWLVIYSLAQEEAHD